MPFSGIVVGAGACGNRMLETQIKYTSWEVDESASYVSLFFGTDLAMDIPTSLRLAIDTADPDLRNGAEYLYLASAVEERYAIPTGGVGGLWNISRSVAEESMEALSRASMTLRSMRPRGVTISMVMHSAGGGTGLGAGPVIASHIGRAMREYQRPEAVLSTAALALPFYDEEDWRKVNALFSIGLYRRALKGFSVPPATVLFIADNGWVGDNYLGGVASEESKRIVNEVLTASTRSIFLPSILPETSTKDLEIPDMRRILLKTKDLPVLVAVGHLEFPLNFLRYMTMRAAIEMTLKYGMTVGVDLSTRPPTSIHIIVQLPYELACLYTGKCSSLTGREASYREFRRSLEDHLDIQRWVRERFHIDTSVGDVRVDYVGSKSKVQIFSVTIFLVDPAFTRFRNLISVAENLIGDEEKFYALYRSSLEDPSAGERHLGGLLEESKELLEDVLNFLERKGLVAAGQKRDVMEDLFPQLRREVVLRALRRFAYLGYAQEVGVRVRASGDGEGRLESRYVFRGAKLSNFVASLLREMIIRAREGASAESQGDDADPLSLPSSELLKLGRVEVIKLKNGESLRPNPDKLDLRIAPPYEPEEILITLQV